MKVIAVCTSENKGTRKTPQEYIDVKVDHGIVGDAHSGNWHRQISLLGKESIDIMRAEIPELKDGDFAENIVTEGIDLYKLPVGTELKIGETVLEVTQIGKECHQGCEIMAITGDCIMPRQGIFTKVIEPGRIQPNDSIEVL